MALFESRDVVVKGFREKLNEFVKGIASEVNAIHITGYGVGETTPTHRYFFVNESTNDGTGIDLSNIVFNPQLNDYDHIAAGEEFGNNEDNRVALKIAELRNNDYFSEDGYETDSSLRKLNFDEFYRSIISDLGNKGQEASTAVDAQKTLVDQIDYRRQAISSVSMDEEMSNLIKYEHSYNAAARIVNVMDEMIDIIVNKVGVVGR